jgi:hypothetical protein
MIATITNPGKVRWMISPGTRNAALFLGLLTRWIAGAAKKVFLSGDHLSVYEAAVVDQELADKTDRIEVFSLPKYAPERNPEEDLNGDVKANINPEGLPKEREELRGKRHRFMQKLAKLPARIVSSFEHKDIASLFPNFYALIAGGSKPVFLLRWDSTP